MGDDLRGYLHSQDFQIYLWFYFFGDSVPIERYSVFSSLFSLLSPPPNRGCKWCERPTVNCCYQILLRILFVLSSGVTKATWRHVPSTDMFAPWFRAECLFEWFWLQLNGVSVSNSVVNYRVRILLLLLEEFVFLLSVLPPTPRLQPIVKTTTTTKKLTKTCIEATPRRSEQA